MRGVPAPLAVTLSRPLAHPAVVDGLVVVLAGAAAGYGGDRKRPVTGVPCAAARRAVGPASEGRGEGCRLTAAGPRGEPRPPTAGHPLAAHPTNCSRALAAHGRGRQARRAEGAPLKPFVEKVVTAPVGALVGTSHGVGVGVGVERRRDVLCRVKLSLHPLFLTLRSRASMNVALQGRPVSDPRRIC